MFEKHCLRTYLRLNIGTHHETCHWYSNQDFWEKEVCPLKVYIRAHGNTTPPVIKMQRQMLFKNEAAHPRLVYIPPLLPLRVQEGKEKRVREHEEAEREAAPSHLGRQTQERRGRDLGTSSSIPVCGASGCLGKVTRFFWDSTSKTWWGGLAYEYMPRKPRKVHSSSAWALDFIRVCVKHFVLQREAISLQIALSIKLVDKLEYSYYITIGL